MGNVVSINKDDRLLVSGFLLKLQHFAKFIPHFLCLIRNE